MRFDTKILALIAMFMMMLKAGQFLVLQVGGYFIHFQSRGMTNNLYHLTSIQAETTAATSFLLNVTVMAGVGSNLTLR